MSQRILPMQNKFFTCSFTQLTYEQVKESLELYKCEILIGGRDIIGDFLIVPDDYNCTKKTKHAKEQGKPIVKISNIHEFVELKYY